MRALSVDLGGTNAAVALVDGRSITRIPLLGAVPLLQYQTSMELDQDIRHVR